MSIRQTFSYILGVAVLSAPILAFSPNVEAGKLLYENTFNGQWGPVRPSGTMKPPSCVDTKYRLEDPLGGSNPAARVFQQGGSECLEATDLRHRAEFDIRHPDGKSVDGSTTLKYDWHKDYFLGYRLYIPSSFPVSWLSSTNKKIIHTSVVRGNTREVALRLAARNNVPTIRVTRRYNTSLNDTVEAETKDVPLLTEAWNDVVLHFRREWTNSGVVQVWVNGELAVDWQGVQTAVNSSIDPRLIQSKTGLYWAQENRPADFMIYIDDLRIAEGADGYGLVAPEGKGAEAGAGATDSTLSPPTVPRGLRITKIP